MTVRPAGAAENELPIVRQKAGRTCRTEGDPAESHEIKDPAHPSLQSDPECRRDLVRAAEL